MKRRNKLFAPTLRKFGVRDEGALNWKINFAQRSGRGSLFLYMCVSSLLFALRSGRTLFSCIHFFLVFYSPLPHTLSPPRVVALCACVYLNPIGKDGRQRTSLDFGYHLLSIHRSCYLPSFRRAELDRSSRPVQDEKISDP